MLISKENQEKLKKIRESGKYCCIDISSDFDYVWDIKLTVYNQDNHDEFIRTKYSYENLNDAINDIWDQVHKLI